MRPSGWTRTAASAADDLAVAVDDVTGEEPQHRGLVGVRVEEHRAPLATSAAVRSIDVADERVEQRVAWPAQLGLRAARALPR